MIESALPADGVLDLLNSPIPDAPLLLNEEDESVRNDLADAQLRLKLCFDELRDDGRNGSFGLRLNELQNDVDSAVESFETFLGYVNDLCDYMRFWRNLAFRLLAERQPQRAADSQLLNEASNA